MKIEPVYLLGTPPDRRPQWTRRSLLAFGAGCFAAGVTGGWWIAMATRRPTAGGQPAGGNARPAAIDDASIAWARERALGDAARLLEDAVGYVSVCNQLPDDSDLQRGLLRLAQQVVVSGDAQAHRAARVLVRHFDRHPPSDPAILDLLPRVREISRR